jgi:hypothetical protein
MVEANFCCRGWGISNGCGWLVGALIDGVLVTGAQIGCILLADVAANGNGGKNLLSFITSGFIGWSIGVESPIGVDRRVAVSLGVVGTE